MKPGTVADAILTAVKLALFLSAPRHCAWVLHGHVRLKAQALVIYDRTLLKAMP